MSNAEGFEPESHPQCKYTLLLRKRHCVIGSDDGITNAFFFVEVTF